MSENNTNTLSLKSIYINIANRFLSLFSSLGLLAIVLITLDQKMQGFYYTFYSLVSLRLFAELGLSYAIVQIISHLTSDLKNNIKLFSYQKFFIKWFTISSSLLSITLIPTIFFFKKQYAEIEFNEIRIIIPWIVLSLGTGASVFITGMLSILEGHQKILDVSKIRLQQSIANTATTIALLFLGMELWALSFGSLISFLVGINALRKHKILFVTFKKSIIYTSVSWYKEIWPFQWRLGMSWISSFFIFYSLTPIVMRLDGPIAAGQTGMSLQILLAINSIAILYVSTHSATFGNLISKQKFKIMDELFKLSFIKSTVLLLLIILTFWIIKLNIDKFQNNIEINTRLLTNTSLFMLTVACICNHIYFSMNYYLRSFKNESLWFISIINSIAIIILIPITIPITGTNKAIATYTGIIIFFWIITCIPYFLKIRKDLMANVKK